MLTCCIPLSAWAAEETADPSQSNAPYAWPLPSSGAITQGYSSDEHQALDIAIEEGTPVLAAESGTVVHTQVWDGVTMDGDQSYGNMVMLSHADGNSTLYAHLSEISVSPETRWKKALRSANPAQRAILPARTCIWKCGRQTGASIP